MTEGPVMRGQYWEDPEDHQNPRADATGHGESLTDMERYLLPLDQVRGSSHHTPGVADGLALRAEQGKPGVRVLPGSGLDDAGRVLVLAVDGAAVVDPAVDPEAVVDVPTVPVHADGVVLTTKGPGGDFFVTATHREVQGYGNLASGPVLVHAPWLRLEAVTGFTGHERIVLGQVSVSAAGAVTGLSEQGRVLAGVPAGRVELRAPTVEGGTDLRVEQAPVARLATRGHGLDLTMLAGDHPVTALSVSAAGAVTVGAELQLAGSGRSYAMASGDDGKWHLRDTSGQEYVTASPGGEGGGLDVYRRMRVRQGGDASAGIWFSQSGPNEDRAFVGMLDDTHVGLFGNTGAAWGFRMHTTTGAITAGRTVLSDLRVTGDAVVGAGGDGRLTVRHVSGKKHVDDAADDLYLNWDTGRGVHVGGGARASLRVWGDAVVGAGGNGRLTVRHVDGKSHVDDAADDLYLNWDTGRGVHVGGGARASLRVWGDAVVGAGGNGRLTVRHVDGKNHVDDAADDLYLNWGTGRAVHVGGGARADLRIDGNVYVDANGGGWPDGLAFPDWSGGGLGTHDVFARGAVYVGVPESAGIALYGDGSASFQGRISKRGGGFTIDHPLDPESRTLSHSFVESPEMMNLYAGTAVTDGLGRAVVVLPGYFDALNRGRRFQLTPIGQFAHAAVLDDIDDNSFTIMTDKPEVTVSWQVSGVRRDPWAEAHPIVVEEFKPDGERGTALPRELQASGERTGALGSSVSG